jgi:phenylacetate-CoA ligase
MRFINYFYLHAVLPLFERHNAYGLAGRMKKFIEWECLSAEEVQARQWEMLAKLLQHAYNTSAFYKQRFDNIRFNPHSQFDVADLKTIPFLTRDDISSNLPQMYSRNYMPDQLFVSATGGTTDTPVKFYRDPESAKQKLALQWQLSGWAGMYPGDKVFYLWGARSDYAKDPSWRWSLYDKYVLRRQWAATSVMTAGIAEEYRLQINKFKPEIIYAYPTPLAMLCEFIEQAGKPVHRPRAVICTAESLLSTQREVIERTLGCRAFVLYGAREFGMIAAECSEHSGLHFASAGAYVEFIPVSDAQEPGLCEIVVTDLLNYGMPLIRYRVNDCVVARQSACRCGRGYPLLPEVLGRSADIFLLPDGSKVPGVALTNRVLQVCPSLKKIQIIQNAVDEFTIRFVPTETKAADGLTALRSNLRKFFPSEVRWTFEQVSNIEREPSGKTRFCISRLPQTKPEDISFTRA